MIASHINPKQSLQGGSLRALFRKLSATAVKSQLNMRMLCEPDSPRRKKIAVNSQPKGVTSETSSGGPGTTVQQLISATLQMVLRSKAKQNSFPDAAREILHPEIPKKIGGK